MYYLIKHYSITSNIEISCLPLTLLKKVISSENTNSNSILYLINSSLKLIKDLHAFIVNFILL